MHVDDFINFGYGKESYARFVLMLFRLPAALSADFADFIKQYKLFCTYEGKRYRCTGASRLGDVWLTPDFSQEIGYKLRVEPEECSSWSDKP